MKAEKKRRSIPFSGPVQETTVDFLYDKSLEEIVLGSALIDPELIYKICGEFKEDLFYVENHKIIARVILELFLHNEAIDIITVTNHLKKNEVLEKVGGAYYIAQLTNRIASTANIEYHLRLLQQYYLSRYINDTCNEIRYKLFNKGNDVFDVYSEMQNKLDAALKDIIKYDAGPVSGVHYQLLNESRTIAESGIKSGVPSGLHLLDMITNGWQKSDLIILAGRPGMGKTAMAICLAINPAINYKMPVAIFELEMSKEQTVGRMQGNLSEIDVSRIVKKRLTVDEINTIEERCRALESAPIYVDDTPNLSLVEFKTKARKLVRENGVKLIIIDYIQLMRSGMNIPNREQEIAEISRGLKALAKELDVPIIALSQLSRGVESRADKRPQLSDLRESGQIEQDADMVLFCFRPEYYDVDEYVLDGRNYSASGLFLLIIAKHRNGALDEIPLTFIHSQTKIINYIDPFNQNNYTFVEPNRTKNESGMSITTGNTSIKPNINFDNEGQGDDDQPF